MSEGLNRRPSSFGVQLRGALRGALEHCLPRELTDLIARYGVISLDVAEPEHAVIWRSYRTGEWSLLFTEPHRVVEFNLQTGTYCAPRDCTPPFGSHSRFVEHRYQRIFIPPNPVMVAGLPSPRVEVVCGEAGRSGQRIALAQLLGTPTGINFSVDGSKLFIAELGSREIRFWDFATKKLGVVRAALPHSPIAVAVDGNDPNILYVAAGSEIHKVTHSTLAVHAIAKVHSPHSIVWFPPHHLMVSTTRRIIVLDLSDPTYQSDPMYLVEFISPRNDSTNAAGGATDETSGELGLDEASVRALRALQTPSGIVLVPSAVRAQLDLSALAGADDRPQNDWLFVCDRTRNCIELISGLILDNSCADSSRRDRAKEAK